MGQFPYIGYEICTALLILIYLSLVCLLGKAPSICSISKLYKDPNCWLVRGSLFIELGCTRDLGKGWRGDLGTFMISRSI